MIPYTFNSYDRHSVSTWYKNQTCMGKILPRNSDKLVILRCTPDFLFGITAVLLYFGPRRRKLTSDRAILECFYHIRKRKVRVDGVIVSMMLVKWSTIREKVAEGEKLVPGRYQVFDLPTICTRNLNTTCRLF
jgi:hypothetical protein